MQGHAGRLVKHDDILVLIEDVERKLHRHYVGGRLALDDLDADLHAFFKNILHPEEVAVGGNPFRIFAKIGQVSVRESSAAKKLPGADACVRGGNGVAQGSVHIYAPK